MLTYTHIPGIERRYYLKSCDTISVLPVVIPLSLVLETVGPLADAETTPLVVLPLTQVGLGHVSV